MRKLHNEFVDVAMFLFSPALKDYIFPNFVRMDKNIFGPGDHGHGAKVSLGKSHLYLSLSTTARLEQSLAFIRILVE